MTTIITNSTITSAALATFAYLVTHNLSAEDCAYDYIHQGKRYQVYTVATAEEWAALLADEAEREDCEWMQANGLRPLVDLCAEDENGEQEWLTVTATGLLIGAAYNILGSVADLVEVEAEVPAIG